MGMASVSMTAQNDVAGITDVGDREGFVGFQIEGTWTGTITFQAKHPGSSTWVSIMATNVTTLANVTTVTDTAQNGIFRIIADGLMVQAKMTGAATGTCVVRPFIGTAS